MGSDKAMDDVPPETVEAFAKAHSKVQEINDKYSPKIQSAESPEEARAAQQEAAKKTASVLKELGLSSAEYSQIAQAMRNNADLRSRVQGHLDDG